MDKKRVTVAPAGEVKSFEFKFDGKLSEEIAEAILSWEFAPKQSDDLDQLVQFLEQLVRYKMDMTVHQLMGALAWASMKQGSPNFEIVTEPDAGHA